jgi:hypothetical protein
MGKAAMSRHVEKCLAEQMESAKPKPRTSGVFHLRVQGRYAPGYWLDVLGAEQGTLYDLDGFLRNIWLECCGHLSQFTIDEQDYAASESDEWGDQRSMSYKLREVLRPGMKFGHEYDFGSTTELELRVVGRLAAPMHGEKVRLLARNVAPEFRCAGCGSPATRICCTCMYETEACFYCDECAEKHEERGHEDWGASFLPVVNSPRMGVCGYAG